MLLLLKARAFAFSFTIVILAALPLGWAGERYPIIFAHGFGVPAELYEKVVPLKKVAHGHGYELHVARTPMGESVQERARILRDEINRLVPSGPFHIVAHSMGGLDARLAIYKYGFGERCLSLTTIATPHHGSAVADYVWTKLERGSEKTELVAFVLKLVDGSVAAIRDLTTARIENTFNARVQDDPRVRYYSMGFYIPSPAPLHSFVPILWLSNKIIADLSEKRNDGMVGTDSSHWGESLGDFPGDHWSQVTQVPFRGGLGYKEVFERVFKNLDRRFD